MWCACLHDCHMTKFKNKFYFLKIKNFKKNSSFPFFSSYLPWSPFHWFFRQTTVGSGKKGPDSVWVFVGNGRNQPDLSRINPQARWIRPYSVRFRHARGEFGTFWPGPASICRENQRDGRIEGGSKEGRGKKKAF